MTQFRDQDFGLFVNDNGRVKRGNIVGSGAGWQWYEMRAYSGFDGFCVALAFDDAGYLMTNATTPDGYQTNEYGQLIINGEVVMHDTHCLAANESMDCIQMALDLLIRTQLIHRKWISGRLQATKTCADIRDLSEDYGIIMYIMG